MSWCICKGREGRHCRKQRPLVGVWRRMKWAPWPRSRTNAHFPCPPEQHDSVESTAGGASEKFGIESAHQKMVSCALPPCSDEWNVPGATPRLFAPNRSSICSSAAHIQPPIRLSTCILLTTRPYTLKKISIPLFLKVLSSNIMLTLEYIRWKPLYDNV